MARKLPEYNASSLADIAFMLLIFFLVTTTMDVDSGLRRKLPPLPPENQEVDDSKQINERNVFEVLVNRNDQLLVESKPMDIKDLKEATKEFMQNPYKSDNLPEFQDEEVEFFGVVPVTKGVISLRNDVGTSYGSYIAVQNELAAAINELRDELSKQKFGKPYEELEKEEQKAVRTIIPQRISEAEPKKTGGK